MNYIYLWLPVIALIVITSLLRLTQRSWLAPGAFFSLIWSGYLIMPLIFAPDFFVEPIALWFIVCLAISLGLGSTIGMKLQKKSKNKIKYLNLGKTKYLIYFFVLMGFVNTVLLLRHSGLGINVFFSLETLSQVARNYAYAKYNENLTLPSGYSLINTFSFIGSFISGMYWAITKKKLAFLIFLPSFFAFMITTAKGGIIYMLVLWLGGFWATNLYCEKTKLLTYKFLTKLILLGGVLFSFFVLLNMFRYGVSLGSPDMRIVLYRLFFYAFGYLGGFSQWFASDGYGFNVLHFGEFSFAGVYNLLGTERQSGIYTNFTPINSAGDATNIYTLFRFVIDDVGIIGSLFVFFTIGLMVGSAYIKVLYQKKLTYIVLLAVFYAQILYSNISSLFSYNTMLLSFMFFGIYLMRVSKLSQKTTRENSSRKRKRFFKRLKITW